MAGLLCALVLLCGAVAVNESWHDALHAHSGHDEATCAVCLFAGGAVGQALPAPVIVTAWLGVLLTTLPCPEQRLASGFLLAPDGRGPPLLVGHPVAA